MKNTGSHDRFPELIGPFLREELSQDDARDLEEHLSTCAACRAEVTALRALTAAPGSLTERERRDLHAGITAALGEAPAAAVVPLSPRWATAAKALSAAAAAALIAAAGIWVGTSGSTDDSGGAESATAGDGADTVESAPEGVREGRPRPSFLGATSQNTADSDGGGGGDDATEEGVLSALELNQQLLADLAEDGPLFRRFAGFYSAPVPAETTQRTLLNLAKQAPEAAFRAQVEDCGDAYLASRPGAALSVAALLGNFEGAEALVIGFATTEDPAGPLNRYTYVIWRVGDCEAPLSSFGGALLR